MTAAQGATSVAVTGQVALCVALHGQCRTISVAPASLANYTLEPLFDSLRQTLNDFPDFKQRRYQSHQPGVRRAYLPLIPSLLQLFTFAQSADLLARLAVQTVCAGTAVLPEEAGRAGATLLPPLLLGVEGGVEGRQGEEPGLLVFGLDIFAQWRCRHQGLPVQVQRLSLVRVHGEFINVLRRQTEPCPRHGHVYRLGF